MNALTIIEQPSFNALSLPMMDALNDADEFMEAAKSEATRAAYKADFTAFSAWCDANGLLSCPAQPIVVAAYLSARAKGKVQGMPKAKPSTLQRIVAAISHTHKERKQPSPSSSDEVKAVMKGIRNMVGAKPRKMAAATSDIVGNMIAACPDTLAGKRDKALLALGFLGAFRRSELVALTVENLAFERDGIRVLIERSKTDQAGEGIEIVAKRGYNLNVSEKVQEWLEAAGITEGPIFRQVNKSDRVMPGALSPQTVRLIVKRYADQIGAPGDFAAHSLRAGFITSAAESGARLDKIQQVSRHRSLGILLGYVRSSDLMKDHSATTFA